MASQECSTEEWRPVKGFVGLYEISSHGRVRSLDRMIMQWQYRIQRAIPRRCKGRVLRPSDAAGYLRVALRDASHKRHDILVHHLVLYAFIGEGEPGEECNHINGNKHHNFFSNDSTNNLEWVTRSKNSLHRIHVLGKNVWNRKPVDTEIMFRLHSEGYSTRAIARMLNIDQRTILRVLHNEHWQQRDTEQSTLFLTFQPHKQIGQRNPRSITPNTDFIFHMKEQGMSNRAIARELGVTHGFIADVISGEHWSLRDKPRCTIISKEPRTEKPCSKCRQIFPLSAFGKGLRKSTGTLAYGSYCPDCQRINSRESARRVRARLKTIREAS